MPRKLSRQGGANVSIGRRRPILHWACRSPSELRLERPTLVATPRDTSLADHARQRRKAPWRTPVDFPPPWRIDCSCILRGPNGPPTSHRPATVARRCGPHGQQLVANPPVRPWRIFYGCRYQLSSHRRRLFTHVEQTVLGTWFGQQLPSDAARIKPDDALAQLN